MRYRWDPPYPTDGRRPGPRPDALLRASDAERNEVADRLSRHFAEGRLDQAEFKVRLDATMGATTRGDLDGLFDDLPPLPDEPTPTRVRRRRALPALLVLLLVVVAAGVSFPHPWVPGPWVVLALIGLYVWRRSGRDRQDRPTRHRLDR
jgi:hypothetical protein